MRTEKAKFYSKLFNKNKFINNSVYCTVQKYYQSNCFFSQIHFYIDKIGERLGIVGGIHAQGNHRKNGSYTVKRVDEVVRHPHLVTQDQKTQVSNKFFDIPIENFTINIELFRHFSQVLNQFAMITFPTQNFLDDSRQTYCLQMSNQFNRAEKCQKQHARGGREPTTYRTTICHSTTAPRSLINSYHNNTWCT